MWSDTSKREMTNVVGTGREIISHFFVAPGREQSVECAPLSVLWREACAIHVPYGFTRHTQTIASPAQPGCAPTHPAPHAAPRTRVLNIKPKVSCQSRVLMITVYWSMLGPSRTVVNHPGKPPFRTVAGCSLLLKSHHKLTLLLWLATHPPTIAASLVVDGLRCIHGGGGQAAGAEGRE